MGAIQNGKTYKYLTFRSIIMVELTIINKNNIKIILTFVVLLNTSLLYCFKKKYKINNIPVLYGGSVNSKNSKEIFSLKNVDGGLIGGASLIASEFCKIYDTL